MTFRIQNEKLFHLPAYLWDCIFLSLKTFLLLLNIYFCLFIYLFGCPGSWLWHMGLRSLTKDGTQAPCIGSPPWEPLDHEGSPGVAVLLI